MTTEGRQPDRRPDPRSGRRGDPRPHRGIARSCSCAPCSTRAQPATVVRRRGRQRDAVPDARSDAGRHADGRADQRQRPGVDHATRCRRSSSPTTAPTPTNDPANAPADEPLITCDADGTVEVHPRPGRARRLVDRRRDVRPAADQNGQWAVNLVLRRRGHRDLRRDQPAPVRREAAAQPVRVRARRLVLSAPSMNASSSTASPASRAASRRRASKTLADQLKYGALPLSFEVVSSDTISATLGSQQLQIGLIAGLIGLALVAIYSLIVYRALGFVIIASLVVMGVLTYLTLCILAWRMGFRLSLAGVAGLIVTIGFTADSFIVYFERIRDELRDGKSITSAVEDGWARAKRTIYISKSINILAAVVLYILADATVKGFAFTLGLTTAIDVLIFIIFTHPVMQLLARTRFFGGGSPAVGPRPRPRSARSTAVARSSARPSPPSGRRGANAGRRARAARRSDARRSPSASRPSSTAPPTHATDRPARRETTDALHEPARQRPLHRQDLVPVRRATPPVVHHRRGARDRLGARAARPARRSSRSSSPADRSSRSRASTSPDQAAATEAVQTVVPDATTKVTTIGDTRVRVQTDQMTADGDPRGDRRARRRRTRSPEAR